MKMKMRGVCALASLACAGGVAGGETVTVTIENLQDSGGFALTPFWLGFHDGSFDVFQGGQAATGFPGIEEIAELGMTGPISSRFASEQPNGQDTTLADPEGAPVFEGGASESATFNLDTADQRFFNYASMVVPTNDLFVGNDSAIELFDAGGNFTGPITIMLLGSHVYDAGTEANDVSDGPAFVQGVDATLGTMTDEPVSLFFSDPGADAYIQSIIGTTTAPGFEITQGFDGQTVLGRITIVPAPGAVGVLALGGMIGLRRRRR